LSRVLTPIRSCGNDPLHLPRFEHTLGGVKKITLSSPLHLSLFLAILTATLIHFVGGWAVVPSRKSENLELSLLAKEIAQAYLVYQRLDDHATGTAFLNRALKRAVDNRRVISAACWAQNNTVVAAAYKEDADPSSKTSALAVPILDIDGGQVGIVTLALNDESNAVSVATKVRLYTVFGFILAFGATFLILRRSNRFIPQLVLALKRVSTGNMDVELEIPEAPELAELADAFNQMVDGIKERDRMRHSLGRIMDPKIAEILIKENPKVGGLRRQATIMFCDIRNYTSICEQLSPDQLQEFLNEYWKETVEIIMEQEGTIDKFHGDGVCVVFGAPNLHDDDPMRAVRTAWRLVKNVERLNKRREAQRKTPIQIGVGIHNGEVIAGNIGSERRMDYTVVGDVVNVAARIEELNKKFGTTILISDNVYEQVEDQVRVKTITLAHLRGHKRPILVHTVREFFEVEVPVQKREAA